MISEGFGDVSILHKLHFHPCVHDAAEVRRWNTVNVVPTEAVKGHEQQLGPLRYKVVPTSTVAWAIEGCQRQKQGPEAEQRTVASSQQVAEHSVQSDETAYEKTTH